jgi:hypothetical protein
MGRSLVTQTNTLVRQCIFALLVLSASDRVAAEGVDYEFDGHLKARLLADAFPEDSVFRGLIGSTALDIESDVRLNVTAVKDAWSFDAAWQLYGGSGDRIELSRLLPDNGLSFTDLSASDDRRLMNLTDVIRDKGDTRLLQRLDRLSVGYASENVVVRVGRQAISWGNGLIFSPMDIVNPFDPTAVDTEYKSGDDMVYVQYLLANGSDLQAAHVLRRNALTGETESRFSTTAIKYHAISRNNEYDLLLARSYDESVVGIGGNRNVGGAVWRGDVVVSNSDGNNKVQLVTNLSYSWVLGGRNMSGIIEYFFNGFGQRPGRYDPGALAQNPGLVQRLERGELFTIGRNYLAGGVLIEMTPLWTLTPNLFTSLDDHSALLQVTTRYSLGDNSDFLAAINLPLGASGTEFGGISAGQGNSYFSTDLSVFAQFAWYF